LKKNLGVHVIIEMYDCDPNTLKNKDQVEKAFLDIAKKSNAHALGSFFHQFNPHGVSGVVIIEESHLSIHTWPEHGYAAVDYFYCSDDVDTDMALKLFEKYFKPGHMSVVEMKRGVLKEQDMYKYLSSEREGMLV